MTRALWAGLVVVAAATGGAVAWQVMRAPRSSSAAAAAPAIKTWRGGETNACMVTVNGAGLRDHAERYNVAMLCGIGRADADPLTDRAITVSRAFRIEPNDFAIEEAVSGPMRVLLADRAAPTRRPQPSQELPAPHEESLWYELVLLPKGVDAFDVRTLGDVERLGGRRLLSEPQWSVLAIRP